MSKVKTVDHFIKQTLEGNEITLKLSGVARTKQKIRYKQRFVYLFDYCQYIPK